MNHLFNHQPLLAILAEVLDYSDLVNLSQIEKRLLSALKIRQQKLNVIQGWAKNTEITLEELTNLVKLYYDLFSYKINKIPPEIGQLTNLKMLYIIGQRISKIPPEIGQLTNLWILNLCGNKISEIPPEIGQLTNLKTLDLGDNGISEIPPSIGHLINLKHIYLSNNQISEIPPAIGQLTNLKELDLEGNEISEIPLPLKSSKIQIYI